MEQKFLNTCLVALIISAVVACATHIRMQEFELDTQTTQNAQSVAQ